MNKEMDMLGIEPVMYDTEYYECYICGLVSSVKRTKPGEYLCNECLKVYAAGKFHPRSLVDSQFKLVLFSPIQDKRSR